MRFDKLGRQPNTAYTVVWSGEMKLPLTWRPEIDVGHVDPMYEDAAARKQYFTCEDCGLVFSFSKEPRKLCGVCGAIRTRQRWEEYMRSKNQPQQGGDRQ